MNVQIDDTIARLLAERHLSDEPLNDWAIRCLEAGYDSRNLRILAGMSAMDPPYEYDDRLRLALRELEWADINPYIYLMQYAKLLARDILADKVDPIEGSVEMYRILQSTDAHSELGAWYEIIEMIWSQQHFAKTGQTDYYYCERDQLISVIKEACSEFLRRAKRNICSLPETSFDEAEANFKEFLKDNDQSPELIWVFREDVIADGFNISIRTSLLGHNHALAKKCYELGKRRNLGINLHTFCTLNGSTCCCVHLPENDLDAQYKLMDNRFVKFSCRIGMPEATPIGNSVMWSIKKLFVNEQKGEFLTDLIPSRDTLLPTGFKR